MLAQQAGAVFHDESPVVGITVDEGGVLLDTPDGKLYARTLVLATNAWLPEIGALMGANWLSRCITVSENDDDSAITQRSHGTPYEPNCGGFYP